jgi:pimeloyl-ACP methyl ester carboxylesterase
MATFVLVAGAWHGPWCWNRVAPKLRQRGHAVETPNLPGCAGSGVAPEQASLGLWCQAVTASIDAAEGPVILVGHSRGGLLVSQVAELRPDRIAAGVYLVAVMPSHGLSLAAGARAHGPMEVMRRIHRAPDGLTTTIDPELAADFMCNDCAQEDVDYAKARLAPEPMAPWNEPLVLTEGNYGRVPRVYIECTRDRVMPLAMQRSYQAAHPCRTVLSLEADHSPFFSAVEPLARHLDSVAQLYGRPVS